MMSEKLTLLLPIICFTLITPVLVTAMPTFTNNTGSDLVYAYTTPNDDWSQGTSLPANAQSVPMRGEALPSGDSMVIFYANSTSTSVISATGSNCTATGGGVYINTNSTHNITVNNLKVSGGGQPTVTVTCK
jgi:hypothetical protein